MNFEGLKEKATKKIEKYDKLMSMYKHPSMQYALSLARNVNLDLLNDLDNLEYNHKVKLPQFIINTMYGYDNLHDMLTEEYFNDSTEEIDSDDVQCWIGENFDKLCYAWLHQNSYEVEEEPKYYVCVPYAGSYYWKTGSLINPIGTATGNNKWTLKNCEFTQKEIDELLPDVEKFKIPVEEVNHVSDR